MFGVFPWLFLSDKDFFFFWVEFVCFCFSHFKVGIMKGLLFIGVVAMQIIQLEMNRQEL